MSDKSGQNLLWKPQQVWASAVLRQLGEIKKQIAAMEQDVGMFLELNPIFFQPIEWLELTSKSERCLRADNILYIGDLMQRTEGELLRIPHLGRRCLNEIKEVLASHGILLGCRLESWSLLVALKQG